MRNIISWEQCISRSCGVRKWKFSVNIFEFILETLVGLRVNEGFGNDVVVFFSKNVKCK